MFKLLLIVLRFVICFILIFVCCSVQRQDYLYIPSDTWQSYSNPEEAGFSSKKLEEAIAFADSIGSTAVFVVYRGAVLVDLPPLISIQEKC